MFCAWESGSRYELEEKEPPNFFSCVSGGAPSGSLSSFGV